jgi:hypothetical protein
VAASFADSLTVFPQEIVENTDSLSVKALTSWSMIESYVGINQGCWPTAEVVTAPTAVRPNLESKSQQWLAARKVAKVGERVEILGPIVENKDGKKMLPVRFFDKYQTVGYVPIERLKLEDLKESQEAGSVIVKFEFPSRDNRFTYGDKLVKLAIPAYGPKSDLLAATDTVKKYISTDGDVSTVKTVERYALPYSIRATIVEITPCCKVEKHEILIKREGRVGCSEK